MFDIRFTLEAPEPLEEGGTGLWGRLTLGDYTERFIAPLVLWQRVDYERQWLEAAQRLVDGAPTSGIVTVAWHSWWPMWREGDRVRVQEHLFTSEFLAPLGPEPDVHRVPYELIAPDPTDISGGHRVSTWYVPLADVAAFARRVRTA